MFCRGGDANAAAGVTTPCCSVRERRPQGDDEADARAAEGARATVLHIYGRQVAGGEHFRATVQKGLEIIQALRGWTSALTVPQFVIDAPGGGGKVPLLREYVEEINDDEVIFRNFQVQRFSRTISPSATTGARLRTSCRSRSR